MKIVNKIEFYTLPEGTLYSDYEPCIFTSLKVKKSTLYSENKPIDFIYESLIGNIDAESSNHFVNMLYDAEEKKTSLPLDFECEERDGLYEDSQLFAIYEKQDLENFIQKLQSLRSVF